MKTTEQIIQKQEKKKEQLVDTFINTSMRIQDLMEKLEAKIDDHYGFEPEEINYNHLGNVQEIEKKLKELVEFIYS